jgi:hypothetical protein
MFMFCSADQTRVNYCKIALRFVASAFTRCGLELVNYPSHNLSHAAAIIYLLIYSKEQILS